MRTHDRVKPFPCFGPWHTPADGVALVPARGDVLGAASPAGVTSQRGWLSNWERDTSQLKYTV